jgi:ABC-type Fe3+-hydroxamate transport system substrate-binding protein
VEVRHARHFEVSYHDGYKLVRTHGEPTSFQTADQVESVEDLVVLVPRGTPPPPLTGELAGAAVVEVPAPSLAVNNDDLLAFALELGLSQRLVAVGGLSMYDDSVRARTERGELDQIRYSWHLPPDTEVLLARQPGVTLLAMDSPHNVPALARTRELGLDVAPAFVWAEADYLARAEWIKFVALFFDLEAEANRIFGEVEARVAELKARLDTVAERPTALWGYHAGDGRWFMAVNNLEARLLRDAGAVNLLEDLSGPVRHDGDELSNEALLLRAVDAEHWILGDIHADGLPPDGFMAEFRAWRQGNLYHNYARSNPEANAYDWYEGAVVRPDLALADLVSLLHPELLPSHELVYLGRLDDLPHRGGP